MSDHSSVYTRTEIITCLMLFLIQNTRNRDTVAMGRKQLQNGRSNTGTPDVVSRTAPPETSLSSRTKGSAKDRTGPRAGKPGPAG